MAEYTPDDFIGKTFLFPENEQGERLRAMIKRKVIETSKHLDDPHDNAIKKVNFHLAVEQGRSQAIMSYVQFWTILTNRSSMMTCTSSELSQGTKDLFHLMTEFHNKTGFIPIPNGPIRPYNPNVALRGYPKKFWGLFGQKLTKHNKSHYFNPQKNVYP